MNTRNLKFITRLNKSIDASTASVPIRTFNCVTTIIYLHFQDLLYESLSYKVVIDLLSFNYDVNCWYPRPWSHHYFTAEFITLTFLFDSELFLFVILHSSNHGVIILMYLSFVAFYKLH